MKIVPVFYRPEALENFEEIFDFIYEKSQNHSTASHFTDRIYNRCEKIGQAPKGGKLCKRLGKNIRMVPFEKSAVILYHTANNAVWITNIFYGGRDYTLLTQGKNPN